MMNLKNNKQEQRAVEQLQKAFEVCSKVGLRFSVMDAELLYANKRMYKECEKVEKEEETRRSGCYPTVAYSQNVDNSIHTEINCFGTMDSCGGW